jgi:hypothetical protein
MSEFFENSTFLNKMNKNHLKDKVLEIMKQIKEKNPVLTINTFICIIDKLNDPSISYMSQSAGMYIISVELWNKHVFESKKNFDLLISSDNLCF